MSDEARITDPVKVVAYVNSARGMYALEEHVNAIEIADPPVVVAKPAGAKVMAWLPVEDEDCWE